MTTWLIVPRDPLVVRDGRINDGRSESATLRFPVPSMVAGWVRTRVGSSERGYFACDDLEDLKRSAIRGPLLVRVDDDASTFFAPAPRDAVWGVDSEGRSVVHAMQDISTEDAATDQDPFEGHWVGMPPGFRGKPPAKVPALWSWSAFERWLVAPREVEAGAIEAEAVDIGHDERMHVRIGETETAVEGMLFGTTGLVFADKGGGNGLTPRQLGLAVDVSTDAMRSPISIKPGIFPAGGERRLVRWQPSKTPWPGPPDAVVARVRTGARCRIRVILLTPAIFAEGWRPRWLLEQRDGVSVRLVGAVVPRPETISGWDFARNEPKPTRRLVPAGSVFLLELDGEPEARSRWVKRIWLQNVSDDEQDRRDGFGLASVGVADG